MEKPSDSILIYGEDDDSARMKKMAADAREGGHKVGLRSLPMIRRGGQRETADLIIVLAPRSPADAALFEGYADRIVFDVARTTSNASAPQVAGPQTLDPPPLAASLPLDGTAAPAVSPSSTPMPETTNPPENPESDIAEALKRKPGRPSKATDPFARMNRAQLVKELGDRSIAFDHKATDENLRELLRLMTGNEKDG